MQFYHVTYQIRSVWRPAFAVRRLCISQQQQQQSATVVIDGGLPRFRVPLPSRARVCQFTMKPLSNSVRDLTDSIKEEDPGVEVAAFFTADGMRIAGSDSIESLLLHDFELQLNDARYKVTAPQTPITHEDAERLSDVRSLVAQLHSAMHSQEHQLGKERQLVQGLEQLKMQLEPLEAKRTELANKASRRARVLTWMGLSFMSLQFGLLARLTWWEYSWDIMEPVTYFVSYGTAVACYAYYVLTKQEYTFPQVWDREYLKKFYKDADKSQFDVAEYNAIRERICDLEADLRRLRDPLLLSLPLQQSSLLMQHIKQQQQQQ